MKHRMVLFGLVVLLVSTLFLQESIILKVSAQTPETHYNMTPDIDCIHLIEDTNFTEAPTLGTNGTSNEFSTDYGTDIQAEVFNYVELKWEHAPGSSIDRRDDYRYTDQEPPSWEYAYFSTTFEWTEDILPTSCLSILEFEVVTTGNFSSTWMGYSVYEINILLIDSNGKFSKLHSEEFLDDAPFVFYSNQLSSWVIEYAWEDMIADIDGNQIAPTDIAEIRVILTPSRIFFDLEDSLFSGSVTMRMRYIDLQVLADFPPESIAFEPITISSVGANTSINYVETVKSPNGTFLTLGRTHLIPDWGVIVRWNENSQAAWVREWSDDAPEGIAADDEFIYTVGHKDGNLSLAIWSFSGNLIQEILYDFPLSSFGLEVGVYSDGELLVIGYSRNIIGEYIPLIVALNDDYSIDWNSTRGAINYQPDCHIYIIDKENSYVQINNEFLLVSPDGMSRGTVTYPCQSFIATSEGYLWCSRGVYDFTGPQFSTRRDLRISQVQYSIEQEIHTTYIHFKYSSNFYDSVWHTSVAIDSKEEYTYYLAEKGFNFRQYVVAKMDVDGEVEWCKSIEDGQGSGLPDDWIRWYEIQVPDERTLCVFGEDLEGVFLKLTMATFNLGPALWFDTIDWFAIGLVAGVVVIADIGIIYYMKRRKQPPTHKEKVDLDKIFDEVFEK